MVNLSFVVPNGDRTPSAVRDAYDRRVLKTITTQSVTAAIWRRHLPPHLAQWLSAQRPGRMLELGLVARPKFLFDELSQAADAAGIVASHERQLFLSDVSELAADFARIVKAVNVEVRLGLVDDRNLQAEATARPGTRLVTIYRVAAVRHLRQDRKPPTPDWEIVSGRTTLALAPAAVVMLKQRPVGLSAKPNCFRTALLPSEVHASRLFYMLQILR